MYSYNLINSSYKIHIGILFFGINILMIKLHQRFYSRNIEFIYIR